MKCLLYLAVCVCEGYRGRILLQHDHVLASKQNGQEWTPTTDGHETANRSFIHFLSPGRVGSCFVGELFKHQGIPYIFEPDNNNGWGQWDSKAVLQEDRIRCIYSCDQCDEVAKKPSQVRKLCNYNDIVAIKTVGGLSDFSILSRIVPSVLMQRSKFMVLFRDPRGMLHSIIKSRWYHLGMESDACTVFLLQYLATKELALVVAKENMRAAFFEQWSQNVEAFAASLFAWAGTAMSDKVRSEAVSSHKGSALAWASELPHGYIRAKTEARHCPEFIQAAGYPIEPPTDLSFISRLRNPLASPITSDEIRQLKHLRGESTIQMSSTRAPIAPIYDVWLPESM